MSREIIKTDSRDSAKCQKSKLGDINGIIEFVLNDNKTKCAWYHLLQLKLEAKNVGGENRCGSRFFLCFSERVSSFSLGLWAIRLSEFFGIRRKVALRGEAYAWAPILKSFDKLLEVGVSSYLSFTLCLSVFMMLELIEAVSGRLIGPKSWNRIVRKL